MLVKTNDDLKSFNNLNRYQQKKFKNNILRELIDDAKADLKSQRQDELSYRKFKEWEGEIIKKITKDVDEKYKIKPKEKLPYLDSEQLCKLCSILFDVKDYKKMKNEFLMLDSSTMDEDTFDKVLSVHDESISSVLKPLLSQNLATLRAYNLLNDSNVKYLGKDKIKDFFTRLVKLIKLKDTLLTTETLKSEVIRLQKVCNTKLETITQKPSYKCSCWQPKAILLKSGGLTNQQILDMLGDDRVTYHALAAVFRRDKKKRDKAGLSK